MFRVRYVVAVLVGLAVGVAAGWITGRGFEPAHQAATTRAHAGHVPRRAAAPPRSNGTQPRQTAPHAYPAPGLQQVQQRIVQCLYESATWRQQVVCLQAVLRLELAGSRSLGLSYAGLSGQPPGQS